MPVFFVYLPLLAPIALIGVFIFSLLRMVPKAQMIRMTSQVSFFSALISIITFVSVILFGRTETAILGTTLFGFSLKLDLLSSSMFTLVLVLGYFVLRFSKNYLDGDKNQVRFLGGICLTLTAVSLLVLAGQLLQFVLAWVATSMSLHRLLVFYPERNAAQIAARKKFIVARLGDFCIMVAVVLIGSYFQSGSLATIFAEAKLMLGTDAIPLSLKVAAIFLVIAGLLKSAQFPTQGWLVEVMETPTPVSALLHAGILNAGVFLVVRFSDILVLFPVAAYLLIAVGAFTALFASVVMLTQANVKTSLAYSSAAHMGFMMLQCGFGAFPLALVHLVAHSFYKAHAFLGAGSLLRPHEKVSETKPKKMVLVGILLGSTFLATAIVLAIGQVLQVSLFHKPATFALGVIFIVGLAHLLSQCLKEGFNLNFVKKTIFLAITTGLAFFTLELFAEKLLGNLLPMIPSPDIFALILISSAMLFFVMITFSQHFIPQDPQNRFWNSAFVHLKNALYTNLLFHLFVGGFKKKTTNKLDSKDKTKNKTDKLLPIALSGCSTFSASLRAALDQAMNKVSPLWPLQDFVAVNPFLGLTHESFSESKNKVAQFQGASLFMDRSFYLKKIEDGEIHESDVEAALHEYSQKIGVPVQSVKAFKNTLIQNQAPVLTPIATVADLAGDMTGNDWNAFLTDRVSSWASNYYDKGQSMWTLPWQSLTPYEAWKAEASIDKTAEIVGLKGFCGWVYDLPNSAEEVLPLLLNELGIDETKAENYAYRLLMSVGGWASYSRYFLWKAELNGQKDYRLRDLLVIRLVWEVALFKSLATSIAGFKKVWQKVSEEYEDKKLTAHTREAAFDPDYVLQLAFEKAWQRHWITKLNGKTLASRSKEKLVQAVFCIDVRSEVFRRSFESVNDEIETLGFAGFFGFPIKYKRLEESEGQEQCPVLLKPSKTIKETFGNHTELEKKNYFLHQKMKTKMFQSWWNFKMSAVSCFAFVGPVGFAYLPKLIKDSFIRKKKKSSPSQIQIRPSIESTQENGCSYGMTLEERIAMAAQALKGMSLTNNFGRFVILVGHGSAVVNNPHAAGLACGACGGHSGESNARVAAAVLNDKAVQEGLQAKGIKIPTETVFLGALHDTVSDEVTLYEDVLLSTEQIAQLESVKKYLAEAGRLTRLERSQKLNLESEKSIDDAMVLRGRDWSQVRQEWGLAGCAAFIAAPRQRTQGISLEGRSFLHSYDWKQDSDFSVLELIMTAPMIVASWINLQYYGSTVDNKIWGCGNKVLHNVTGLVGVLEGNGGDLRAGLPWQSVHNGKDYVHEPLRLSVIIEAPQEAMTAIIQKHDLVRELLDNGWIHLFAMDERGKVSKQYIGNFLWKDLEKSEDQLCGKESVKEEEVLDVIKNS